MNAIRPTGAFADHVSMTMLLERVVPPNRPPEDDVPVWWVLAFGLLLILGGVGAWLWSDGYHGGGVAFMLGALLAIAVAATKHFRYGRAIVEYRQTYEAAWSMAVRLLSGKPAAGDSEQALRALAETILKTSSRQRGGTTWAFVWWGG